jgi:hypothetical protein
MDKEILDRYRADYQGQDPYKTKKLKTTATMTSNGGLFSKTVAVLHGMIMNYLAKGDQARCHRISMSDRQLLQAAHERRQWIWNGRARWHRIDKRVREVKELVCFPFEQLYMPYPGRFSALRKLSVRAQRLNTDSTKFIHWPPNLTSLTLVINRVEESYTFSVLNLPPNLLHLRLKFVHRLDYVGGGLVSIKRDTLPSALLTLRGFSVDMLCDPSDKTPWPPGLRQLPMLYHSDDLLKIPATITDLSILTYHPGSDQQPLPLLPANLQHLTVSVVRMANWCLSPSEWPPALKEITIGRADRAFLQQHSNWPKTLEILRFREIDIFPQFLVDVSQLLDHFKWPKSLKQLIWESVPSGNWEEMQNWIRPDWMNMRVVNRITRVIVFERKS